METETIDKLFLELAQVTTARTRREIELERRVAELERELEGHRLAGCWSKGE